MVQEDWGPHKFGIVSTVEIYDRPRQKAEAARMAPRPPVPGGRALGLLLVPLGPRSQRPCIEKSTNSVSIDFELVLG